MNKILKVVLSFLKIGAIGFGGGSALIPIAEKEVVDNKKLISLEKYNENVIVSNITPGALPVKLGAGVGEHFAGLAGSILSAFALALPGTAITLLFLSLLTIMPQGVLHQVEFASIGISAFIILLLVHYITKVLKTSKKQGNIVLAVVLTLSAFVLTCGKEIRQIISSLFNITLSGSPIFDISTINLLILTFFIIFFTGGKKDNIRIIIATIFSVLFILLNGKAKILDSAFLNTVVLASMALLGVTAVILDTKKEIKNKADSSAAPSNKTNYKKIIKTPLIAALSFFAVFIVSAAVILFVCRDNFATIVNFIQNAIVSAVTSFGGGEAYLTVAQGIFVDSGIISSSVFYSQILPVANALPGPILVKILSGVAYYFGFGLYQSVGAALAFGAFGFIIGVCFTAIVFWLVFAIYRCFSNISVFETLKVWILPIICGLLLSTICSMIYEMLKITSIRAVSPIISVVLFAVIYIVSATLSKKTKLSDLVLILISAVISITAMNIL